jgi:two-component system chemotaxis response regulator CheB
MGIVLTGMGRDGAAGLLELQRAGGLTVAQSEDSCVVFEMPREAIRLGAAQHVLAPPEIVALIRACTATPYPTGR